MPRFAANLSWLFQEWSFLDRFAAAADAGFTAVEYLFPYDHAPDEIARRLARHNLKQVLFNIAPGNFAAGVPGQSVQLTVRAPASAIARALQRAVNQQHLPVCGCFRFGLDFVLGVLAFALSALLSRLRLTAIQAFAKNSPACW